jgi:excisionase family DNA binding protein
MKLVPNDDHMYTAEEVASYLRVHSRTILRCCRRGSLPAFKVGGKWRISAIALDEFLRGVFSEQSPALRDGERSETLKGKPRQRRAPLLPRPPGQNQYTKRREEAVST